MSIRPPEAAPPESARWIGPLERRRDELERRLGRIRRDRRRERGPLEADFAEQAVVRENDEVLDGLDEVERSQLAAVRAALERIDAGCFGLCDECGEPIDPYRLDAQPWAERCLACERAVEGREGR